MLLGLFVILGTEAQTRQSSSTKDIERLIIELQSYSDQSGGIYPNPWYQEFIATDEELSYSYTHKETEMPSVFPPYQKLVQIGVHALPNLIAHLSDDRVTDFSVDATGNGYGGIHVSLYYDPRHRDPAQLPKGVVDRARGGGTGGPVATSTLTKYTVKVGDLCYIAIGQIVNRSLLVFDSFGNGPGVLLSPIESPSLALAVKKDWAGLTQEDHAKQLKSDSYGSEPLALEKAVRRFAFYYPDHASEFIKRRIKELEEEDNDMNARKKITYLKAMKK